MTDELSNLDKSESEQLEPAMVSEIRRLEGQGWHFEI